MSVTKDVCEALQNMPDNILRNTNDRDNVVLMCIYPKRGPLAAVDLVNAEYTRLQTEVFNESKSCMLHQVDILQGLKELNLNASLQGDKQKD